MESSSIAAPWGTLGAWENPRMIRELSGRRGLSISQANNRFLRYCMGDINDTGINQGVG